MGKSYCCYDPDVDVPVSAGADAAWEDPGCEEPGCIEC